MAVPLFPTFSGLLFPVRRKGPIFDTIVQEAISGRQTAFANRATPKWTWQLSIEMLRTGAIGQSVFTELQTLAGFYASRFGRLLTFGYRDTADYAVVNQPLGTGNGSAASFQLVRSFGGFTEPVFVPTLPIALFADGVALPASAFTVSGSGLVTLTSAPAAGVALTWSGEFAWLCRFDNDLVELENFMAGFWSASEISFTSVVP